MRFNTNNYKDVRAFSENQYLDVLANYPDEGFEEYGVNEDEGTFEGEIVLKKWGRKRNIIPGQSVRITAAVIFFMMIFAYIICGVEIILTDVPFNTLKKFTSF